MSGRTSWWAKDAAWHRRELQVELGEEHGPAGPMVLDVLSSWAQEQRAGGQVRGGFRILAREAFIQPDLAKAVVEDAARIGALDDLEVDEDGRRFTCRVSGFRADQQRGRAAWRKEAQRERDADEAEDGTDGANGASEDRALPEDHGDAVTDRDTSRAVTERPPPDQTRPSSLRSERAGARDDQWPERLAPELHPAAERVHQRLAELATHKKTEAPCRRRVGEIVADYPEHDHVRVVGDVVDYWRYGKGARTRRTDWARVYRDRCSRVPAGGATVVPLRAGTGPTPLARASDALIASARRQRGET